MDHPGVASEELAELGTHRNTHHASVLRRKSASKIWSTLHGAWWSESLLGELGVSPVFLLARKYIGIW